MPGPKKVQIEAEEKLIEQVRDRPYLFNVSDADYKNKLKKSNAWSAIGTFLDLSGGKLLLLIGLSHN